MLSRFNGLVPGFVDSPEFQSLLRRTPASVVITRFYQQTLGRSPSPAEVAAWVDVVARTGDWTQIANGFLNSPEYLGAPRSSAEHVVVLYRTFLGRQPSVAEVSAWVNVLLGSLSAIEDGFVFSPEFQARLTLLLS